MGNRKNGKNKCKTLHRILSMLLVVIMAFSICDPTVMSLTSAEAPSSNTNTKKQQKDTQETREEIKTRLMQQIRYENWDPYSENMSLEEFYALMELFEEGKLPLQSSGTAGRQGIRAPGVEEPGTGDPSDSTVYVPRRMFMFGGLEAYTGEVNKPLDYDNDSSTDPDYPPGLDDYRSGYKLPPVNWPGVPVKEKNGTEAFVIVPDINEGDPGIAGDVDQSLFLKYEGYYVRRVTTQSTEVTVLGAVRLPGPEGKYVYYYLTGEGQSTEVSTTTLPEGQKFIVQYAVGEHMVDYQLYMDSINSSTALPGGITKDTIFGTDRPAKTEDGKYAFTATVPYGYILELYLVKEEDEVSKGNPIKELGSDSHGSYESVNGGWALGMEPDYLNGSALGATVLPNTNSGPSTLTMSGTFYNNNVTHTRTVIGVLKKKADPVFLFAPLKHNSANVSGRGTSAVPTITAINKETGEKETTPYDYEDVYLWVNDKGSKYDYTDSTFGGASLGNVQAGNIATDDGWGWNSSKYHNGSVEMTQNDAGDAWDHTFTFQTNNGDDYVLDSLEINGISITIPFYPKYKIGGNDYTVATGIGISQCATETTLPDGTVIKVEHLAVFGDRPAQHVYRISVTGARSNVTITGMNLMQYNQGAKEFSVYYLNGIVSGDSRTAGIEFYNKNNDWVTALPASINVDDAKDPAGAINYNGDDGFRGANFRFKLADGYDSPYFLWESTRTGVIVGQASASRDVQTGEVTTRNPVKDYLETSGTLDSQYIYGPDADGYYYFRVTTQEDYKIALLTVVARPVRYVVRYIPSYHAVHSAALSGNRAGVVDEPGNMPQFSHYRDLCHESFFREDNNIPGEQYDDKDGMYYDTAVDTVIVLPVNIPTDPNNEYVFVDWVLVDEHYMPVTDDSGGEFHFRGSNITLADINQYAIANEELGDDETDIYVLRLMPVWKPIEHPFSYSVVLRWVDAQGFVYEADFKEWGDILTDWNIDEDGSLTVKILTNAAPLRKWLIEHPTYSFWDAVNNAMSEADVKAAVGAYLPTTGVVKETDTDIYERISTALNTRDISGGTNGASNGNDDFTRIGDYAFQVEEDGGTVVVWMYEDKGYLAITEKGGASNENFLYRVKNKDGDEIIVSVKGGGKTYICAPLGEYTVEEISDWAWRYEEGVCDQSTENPKGNQATVQVTGLTTTIATAAHADYTNARNHKTWLGGENSRDNLFVLSQG